LSNLVFKPFDKQKTFLLSKKRFRGAFAGKRGGKTEVGAIASAILQEEKPNYKPNGIDPYLGVIIAPTNDMLKRLSWKKFEAYVKPCGLVAKQWQAPLMMQWHDSKEGQESLIYGMSGDRPERIEGVKANWIWIDEVFQIKEQLFLECLARVSDSQGYIICTGSLGVQFVNPKQHWAYKYFKEQIDDTFDCHEWGTSDNPYYPQEELERNRNLLDPQTFRAMFEICWDVIPKNAVYSDFSDDNIVHNLMYNPSLPVVCCVDWGWSHPMAVGMFQYDPQKDEVYLIDEMIKSKVKLEDLAKWIASRPYGVQEYICDIAGNQEREQTGKSNIKWFLDNHGVRFKYRTSRINAGCAVVRSYIKNAKDKIRFFVGHLCTESIDGLKRYKYPEKDGIIQNENPVKEDDDACDMIRYYFMYKHDPKYLNQKPVKIGMYR
jgi:phage terminase large subunit